MKYLYKRLTAVCSAVAITFGAFSAAPVTVSGAAEPVLHSEAEALTVTDGGQIATKVYNDEYPGFSGEGFVWAGGSGGMKFEVDLKEGAMYTLSTRCYSYLGDRDQKYAVDGKEAGTITIGKSEAWEDVTFGSFYLDAGKHTIEIGSAGSWGYILYDTVTFDYAVMPELKISTKLSDPKATAQTQSLMNYLTSIYGKQILTGQQEIYGSGHDNNPEVEFDYLKKTTGKSPAVRGFDFMNYNPLYGWDDQTTERAIAWATEKNGIVTASWHINVPKDFANYTVGDAVDWQQCSYKNYQASGSTFNTANILDESSKERAYFDEAVKQLAAQLLRVQEEGVPIIWRPLHEAQGNYGRYGDGTSWFWWGDRGPEVFKGIWKLLYTELTETYGLHNLIWEMNLYELDNSMEWYPGDEYVDMVGYDKYEGSPYKWETAPATSVFLKLVEDTNDTKLVAMAECDKIPDITSMKNEGAWWLYVCPWYFDGDSDANNTAELLKDFYNSDYVATLDELPKDLYTAGGTATTTSATTTTTTVTSATTHDSLSSTTTTTTTTTSVSTSTTVSSETKEAKTGDVDDNGSVSVADAVLLARLVAEDKTATVTEQGRTNADLNKNGSPDSADLTMLLKMLATS